MKKALLGIMVAALALSGCTPKDQPLKDVTAKLAPLRKLPMPRAEDEFPPSYFEARDSLRDWVDKRITTLGEKDSDFEFATKLNQELKDAKLNCAQCDAALGGVSDASGFVGEIRATHQGKMLQVTTQMGVQCGFDETAYLYRWAGDKWVRVWDSAEPLRDGKYEPQTLDTVRVSDPSNTDSDRRVLVLARFPGCKSAWQPVYYRLSNLTDTGSKLLIDERALSPVPTRGAPIAARLSGDDDLLVEYQVQSLDPAVGSRMKIVHYRLLKQSEEKTSVDKIMPYALGPRDFVEEWLMADDEHAAAMTPGGDQPALQEQHKQLHRDNIHMAFNGSTSHCGSSYEQVQVHVTFTPNPAKPGEEKYFHLRWVPPYLFDLAAVTDTPNDKCGDGDPRLDSKRTLFYRR